MLEVVQQEGIQVSHKNVPAQMLRAKTEPGWAQRKVIRIPGPTRREELLLIPIVIYMCTWEFLYARTHV